MTVLKMHNGSEWEAVSGPPGPQGPGGGGGLDQATADGLYINIDGDTMTGALMLFGPPSLDLMAATKAYVDNAESDAVQTANGYTDDQVVIINGQFVPLARTISTTAPLTGGGDLSANRTFAVSAASETATGVVELATSAEVSTGTDNTRAVHPAGLSANYLKSTSARLTVSNTAPSSPAVNDVWIDTT